MGEHMCMHVYEMKCSDYSDWLVWLMLWNVSQSYVVHKEIINDEARIMDVHVNHSIIVMFTKQKHLLPVAFNLFEGWIFGKDKPLLERTFVRSNFLDGLNKKPVCINFDITLINVTYNRHRVVRSNKPQMSPGYIVRPPMIVHGS